MEPFEFLLLFAALLLGVAVTDLATSLHRLLGRQVRWDWLAPLAGLVAFLKIVTQWWTWYGLALFSKALTWEMFLSTLASSILLFLMTAAALPDSAPPGEVIDLRAHWAKVHRRYWTLFLMHWLLVGGLRVYASYLTNTPMISPWPPGLVVVPACVLLILFSNRWLQTVGLVGFWAIYTGQFFGRSLSG